MDKKYKVVVPTPEEEASFQKDFEELAKKHSFHIELVPQFKANTETKAYEVTCVMLLRKVVEDTEVVVEGAVPSTDPEVNPLATNEPNKEA